MKKLVAILLILVMAFSLSSIAFAATNVISPSGGDEDPDQPSHQTGDLANIWWVVIAARAELNKTTGEKPVTQKMFRAI